MKRRFLVGILVVACIVSLCVPNVSASGSGYIGDMTWYFNSYTKTMYLERYSSSDGPMYSNHNTTGTYQDWIDFQDDIEHVVIESGFTTIASNAFYFLTNLKSVSIPDTVTKIYNSAFSRCYSLTDIVIPDGVTVIGDSAFANCSSLTSIVIPDSVTALGMNAFSDCTSLVSVTLPAVELPEKVFYNCEALESVTFTTSNEDARWEIGKNAFYDCHSLTEIVIPDGYRYVMDYAFWKCGSLLRVELPATMYSIESNAFYQCTNLKEVVLQDTLKYINSGAFMSCTSLESITIPAGVEKIENIFPECTALKEIYFVGDAPEFVDKAFRRLTLTAYYPYNNTTWTENVRQQYGGTVSWVASGLPLAIIQQPKDVKVAEGETATVTVEAQGDGLTYQWYYKNPKGDVFFLTNSFTGDTYSVVMNTSRSGRQIYCVITDKYGNSVTTDTVTLRMETGATELKIVKQPEDVTVAEGETATVTVEVQGDGLTYKWYYKNPKGDVFFLTNSFTGDTYSVVMNTSRSGRQIYCVITDQYGNTVTTNTVTLKMK